MRLTYSGQGTAECFYDTYGAPPGLVAQADVLLASAARPSELSEWPMDDGNTSDPEPDVWKDLVDARDRDQRWADLDEDEGDGEIQSLEETPDSYGHMVYTASCVSIASTLYPSVSPCRIPRIDRRPSSGCSH